MKPLDDTSRELGYNVILRGSKMADARVGVENGFVSDGVTYLSPLWDWTHEEVFTFLRDNKVVLPPHYQFFPDSLDCYNCTGHMHHFGAERIKFIRAYHPDKWPSFEKRIATVKKILSNEHRSVLRAYSEGLK